MTELEAAVADRWEDVERELGPRVRAAVAANPRMDAGLAVALNVTQNVLKEALAPAMRQAMPQGVEFFGELATRLACYVITAAHPDDQERLALGVARALLPKLADMQAAGNVLKGEWV